MLIDLFDPEIPVLTTKVINPGNRALLFNIDRVENRDIPQVIATAARVYDEEIAEHSYAFLVKSPLNTTNVMRILLPKKWRISRLSIILERP